MFCVLLNIVFGILVVPISILSIPIVQKAYFFSIPSHDRASDLHLNNIKFCNYVVSTCFNTAYIQCVKRTWEKSSIPHEGITIKCYIKPRVKAKPP